MCLLYCDRYGLYELGNINVQISQLYMLTCYLQSPYAAIFSNFGLEKC